MNSASLVKFKSAILGAQVLGSFTGAASPISPNQHFTDQSLLKGAVALAVGCWEGYLGAVEI